MSISPIHPHEITAITLYTSNNFDEKSYELVSKAVNILLDATKESFETRYKTTLEFWDSEFIAIETHAQFLRSLNFVAYQAEVEYLNDENGYVKLVESSIKFLKSFMNKLGYDMIKDSQAFNDAKWGLH